MPKRLAKPKITNHKSIKYPFTHQMGEINYVPADNEFMLAAKEFARHNSLDDTMPTATVIVKDAHIIGRGANGSDYHKSHVCERVRLNIPTGEGYDLCEGCHPKNHSESKAVADAKKAGYGTKGAEAYLWGHWWACEPCWNTLVKNGITKLYLLDDCENLFNKLSSKNIVGKQFV